MSRFVKRVPDCKIVPSGYGVAWYDSYSMHRICMPLGVNYIAGVLRRVQWFVGCGYKPYELAELRHELEMSKRQHTSLMREYKSLSERYETILFQDQEESS